MQITKAQATMTSLELVDTINEVRAAEGKKPLRHDNFIVKIEKHPAIDSPKYLGQYKDSTGRELKCYRHAGTHGHLQGGFLHGAL